jgi:putative transposase
VRAWTALGSVRLSVLFFIHIGSRRVRIAGISAHPNSAWVAEQAKNTCAYFAAQEDKPTLILRDNDSKFSAIDSVFAAEGIAVKKVGPGAPNMNAHAERWVQSVRRECLDHFIILGETHLRHLLKEYEEHHNLERPHQGIGNVPLTPQPQSESEGSIECRERLGVLLKHYYRKSA